MTIGCGVVLNFQLAVLASIWTLTTNAFATRGSLILKLRINVHKTQDHIAYQWYSINVQRRSEEGYAIFLRLLGVNIVPGIPSMYSEDQMKGMNFFYDNRMEYIGQRPDNSGLNCFNAIEKCNFEFSFHGSNEITI